MVEHQHHAPTVGRWCFRRGFPCGCTLLDLAIPLTAHRLETDLRKAHPKTVFCLITFGGIAQIECPRRLSKDVLCVPSYERDANTLDTQANSGQLA